MLLTSLWLRPIRVCLEALSVVSPTWKGKVSCNAKDQLKGGLHRGVLAVCLLYTDNLLALATSIAATARHAQTSLAQCATGWKGTQRVGKGWHKGLQSLMALGLLNGLTFWRRIYVVANTPRVRNLLELVASELWDQGVDPFRSDAILDIPHSYGRHALRVDGLLPVVATTSRIVLRLRVVLQPTALLSVLGFPVSAYQADRVHFDDTSPRRMVGNTMRPGAVGPVLLGLLGLLKHPV